MLMFSRVLCFSTYLYARKRHSQYLKVNDNSLYTCTYLYQLKSTTQAFALITRIYRIIKSDKPVLQTHLACVD